MQTEAVTFKMVCGLTLVCQRLVPQSFCFFDKVGHLLDHPRIRLYQIQACHLSTNIGQASQPACVITWFHLFLSLQPPFYQISQSNQDMEA